MITFSAAQIGSPIWLTLFDDRIEIENPGILIPGLTIEDMIMGVSKLRNHVIARVFRELDLIDQWGSGVRRMFREAEELGLPRPEIIEVGMRLRFIVYLAEPLNSETPTITTAEVESRLKSELAAKVFILLTGGVASKAELACGLGHKTVSGELHKQIRNLLERGYIEITIPDKPRSSKQKYRLSAKGREFLTKEGQEDME